MGVGLNCRLVCPLVTRTACLLADFCHPPMFIIVKMSGVGTFVIPDNVGGGRVEDV